MRVLSCVIGALVVACHGSAVAQGTSPYAEYRASSHVHRGAPAEKRVQAKGVGEHAMAIKLAAPTGVELSVPKSNGKDVVAARIGFAREVRALADDGLLARMQWKDTDGGARVAQLALTSPDAAALRLGIVAKALPLQAVLRFHDGSGRDAFEVTGEDILEAIATNLEMKQSGDNARTWWSPVIESSTAVIEIELPAGTQPAQVRMSVPQISHLLSSAKKGFAVAKAETSCGVDAKCHEVNFGNEMNAEARLLFTRDGVTYACSGTLVANQDSSSEIPYFHTASHCISSQSDASTLSTYWFYRANACNSGVPGRYEVRNGGATLLFTHMETDTVLLRLNTAPPAGAVYMGWKVAQPLQMGTPVTGIHHASTDVQKVSFGDVSGYASCLRGAGMCRSETLPGATFYFVKWRAGATQGGSSGSPLVADDSRSLVGHLSGGMSSCTANGGGDYYGRFDLAYHAGLHRWLGATPVAAVATPATQPPAPRVMTGPRLRLTTTLSIGPRTPER